MLSRQKNEYLTRIGPGEPMGKLLRAFWIPVLYSHELPAKDGPPLRVRLLGENLVAFRDSSGRVGLLDHRCPHRQASLFFGRNENDGLRCVYHGWQFDVDGKCLDIPNEPPDCPLLGKVRAPAYPCRELNGVIWTYMGEGTLPPLPAMGWARVPIEQKGTLKYLRHCNWVQAMEGDCDSSHLGFLHRVFDQATDTKPSEQISGGDALRSIVALDKRPKFEIEDTPVGITYGACREAPEGGQYWRITQFHLPFYTSVPAYNGMNRLKIWVPMDDTHTMVWEANWSGTRQLNAEQRKGWKGRVGPSGFLPDTDDWFGRGRFAASEQNDYLIDRERQRTLNFSGMEMSTPIQDAAVQESMGGIVDRSFEHLSAADAVIIALRKRLLSSAEELEKSGRAPACIARPDVYHSHGEQFLLPDTASWKERYEHLMREEYRRL
jgi:phthalate 4,5-dioxygenase oxygenase subunit